MERDRWNLNKEMVLLQKRNLELNDPNFLIMFSEHACHFLQKEDAISLFQGCNQNYSVFWKELPMISIFQSCLWYKHLWEDTLEQRQSVTLLISQAETWKLITNFILSIFTSNFFPGFWWIFLSVPFCWCLWLIWWTLTVTKIHSTCLIQN